MTGQGQGSRCGCGTSSTAGIDNKLPEFGEPLTNFCFVDPICRTAFQSCKFTQVNWLRIDKIEGKR
jgi:hypothetical protein